MPSRFSTFATSRLAAPAKETLSHYGTSAHKQWSQDVIKRAAFACEDCGAKGQRLYADHIQEIADAPSLALDPRNGRARCASCHGSKTHKSRIARFNASPLA